MLMDKITIADIQTNVQAENWEDAIEKTSQLLLERGIIEQSYIDAMIQVVKENGPYIVIGKHIALAHARPECGVNAMGLTFSTLNPPISFGADGMDPVKLVITLAATDSDAHVDLLAEIAEIFMDEERLEALIEAESSEIFLQVLLDKS